ncbi:hypothetical protein ARMGADRAFT_1085949 [Armillaria gallica]|uniref:Uncharacterized protein n=1 Tax=Armillaria gallica TaxID=47427 RepID=A0A2H3DDL2_ARMGA|nr:hypothetical protein ARMGADRAFT_1085949 [Armillaria gallica]
MSSLCISVNKGGDEFDYRLSTAITDMRIELLKHKMDDKWNTSQTVHILKNRRYEEKSVAYCESHDRGSRRRQMPLVLVGGADKYSCMSDFISMTPAVSRDIALNKMIRYVPQCIYSIISLKMKYFVDLTYPLGSEGYLNFEGNEFGHPERLDFLREGNSNSFHYARRQWDLVDNPLLRYKYLNSAMTHADKKYS